MNRILVIAAALLILTACTKTQLVYDVGEAVVVTGSGKAPTLDEMRAVVARAVLVKTWKIDSELDGRLNASLAKGSKIARIQIDYSPEKYSIVYQSSELLLAGKGRIHRRYNAWIRGLEITINRSLGDL
jgi:hypothetical protein